MRTNLKYTALALLTAGSVATFACSASDDETTDGGAGAGNPTSTGGNSVGGGNTGGTGGGILMMTGGGNTGGQENCVDLALESEGQVKPADIVFVIDNSGSMGEEANQVEQNINGSFATLIANSGIDYRVVMLTQHSTSSTAICVGPPLSAGANCSAAPGEIPGQFYHYDIQVESHDALCIMLDTLYGSDGGGEADEQGLYPQGWITALRPEAVKVFVMITDDGISCTWNSINFNDGNQVGDTMPATFGKKVAIDWDKELLALSPGQFGTVAERNYLFYSITAIPFKVPKTDPYDWFEPVTTAECTPGGVDPGTGYQWLSVGTQSLRFPVCADGGQADYSTLFQDIAAGVVEGVQIPCDITVTDPMGQMIDYNTVKVNYTPGMGAAEQFSDAGSEAACGLNDDQYWVDQSVNPVEIHLCPSTCTKVTGDSDAELDVVIACGGIAN